MTCSKSTANVSGLCKRNDTDGGMLMTLDRHMQWLVNTSLPEVTCRCVWLSKVTYPVTYRLTLNKSDLLQTSNILTIIYKQLPSISAIRATIYEITWSLPLVPTLHKLVQLKWNSDVNRTIELSQKQIRGNAKQNSIRWCQQSNKPGAICRTECDFLKGYELRTNYVKNTTTNSFCDLEHVTHCKYVNQK